MVMLKKGQTCHFPFSCIGRKREMTRLAFFTDSGTLPIANSNGPSGISAVCRNAAARASAGLRQLAHAYAIFP